MDKTDKIKIENKFFDLISIFLSFIVSLFKSLLLIIWKTWKIKTRFFDLLDFVFTKWPKYFWEKPSLYKASWFIKDLINNLFYKQK